MDGAGGSCVGSRDPASILPQLLSILLVTPQEGEAPLGAGVSLPPPYHLPTAILSNAGQTPAPSRQQQGRRALFHFFAHLLNSFHFSKSLRLGSPKSGPLRDLMIGKQVIYLGDDPRRHW